MKLIKSVIDKLKPNASKPTFFRDQDLKGFGLKLYPTNRRVFIIEKRINGKVKRITLGSYPELTAEQARKKAQSLLGDIAMGVNPVAQKKRDKLVLISLAEALNDYTKARRNLKQYTVKDYEKALNQVVPDWLEKPLITITKEMITARHEQHGKMRSKARANLAMRVLRAIFNFAIVNYEDPDGKPIFTINPVSKLSHNRGWYKIDRRQTVIKPHELKPWYEAIEQLGKNTYSTNGSTYRDFFMIAILTGLRRSELESLQWQDIDFHMKTLSIADPKNRNPHILPLSDYLMKLLQHRHKMRTSEQFIFPASNSKAGHIADPRKSMLKIQELSGVKFTIHDLRRTFITVAESLDIPHYALKKLLNHKNSADVTSGYLIIDADRLRDPMQKVTDYFMKTMEITKD